MGLKKFLKKAKKAVKKGVKSVGKLYTAPLKAASPLLSKVPIIGGAASLAAKTNAALLGGNVSKSLKLAIKKGPKALGGVAQQSVATGFLGAADGFLSDVGGWIGNAQSVLGQVQDLAGQFSGDNDAGGLADAAERPSDQQQDAPASMTPFLLVGAAAVVAIVVLNKRGRS